MKTIEKAVATSERHTAYKAPTLTFLGTITEVVQNGNGKLSINAPDGPDARKPPGQ